MNHETVPEDIESKATEQLPTNAKELLPKATKDGFLSFLDLAKLIIPVYLVVEILKYTGVIAILADVLAPVMRFFGLPGEAAMVLITGWFISLYSSIGVLAALKLPAIAVTSISLMLLFCHAIPIEWVILQKMGARAWRVTIVRFVVSILVGAIFALIYREQLAAVTVGDSHPEHVQGAAAFSPFIKGSLIGLVKLLTLILAIIVPITVLSEWARAKEYLPKLVRKISPAMGRLNLGEGHLLPLLIGLSFGIVYGGGAMIALARAGAIKKEEAQTVGLFLGLCHSLIEDPTLFIALGGSWVWLYIIRVFIAMIFTLILRRWI